MEVDCENDTVPSKLEKRKSSILNCVAESKGFFKSQQVGETDLTFDEKWDIAKDLLDHNVPLFLQRYWKYIKLEDIGYFDGNNDYDVIFYLTEIRKFCDKRGHDTRIKNRRYGALKQMIKEGTYFSDSEMKQRNPFQFDQFVGKYQSESERIAVYKEQHQDEKFSSFLISQFEKNVENCLYQAQKEEEEAVVEEEDDDELSEESELEDEQPTKVPSDQEKAQLRSEFMNIMYESFLLGKDKKFDYSTVDQNAEYDPAEQDLDAEDKYFQSDSPEAMD